MAVSIATKGLVLSRTCLSRPGAKSDRCRICMLSRFLHSYRLVVPKCMFKAGLFKMMCCFRKIEKKFDENKFAGFNLLSSVHLIPKWPQPVPSLHVRPAAVAELRKVLDSKHELLSLAVLQWSLTLSHFKMQCCFAQ